MRTIQQRLISDHTSKLAHRPMLVLTARRRPRQGGGIKDVFRTVTPKWVTESLLPATAIGIKSLGTTVSKFGTNLAAPWLYGKTLLQDWMEGVKWFTALGRDLPELEPELALFTAQAEQGPNSQRNKAIISRLLDLNRRYMALNTTPAKNAFNRIIHATALNSIRQPESAGEEIARADLDLGKLFREYLGSPSDRSEVVKGRRDEDQDYNRYQWGRRWVPFLGKYRTQYPTADELFAQYHVKSGLSPYEQALKAQALPSHTLGRQPFPDEQTSGQFVPSYEKQRWADLPSQYHPKLPRRQAARPSVQYVPAAQYRRRRRQPRRYRR